MLGLAPLTGGGLLSAVGLFISTDYETMLIIEDGLTTGGVVNANAFVTRTEVSAHATLVGNTAWDAATELAQEQAIYRTMSWVSTREPFMKGCRTWPTTQELSFPRTGVCAYGREILYNAIPKEFKQAIMEGALLEEATPDALAPSAENNIKRIKKKLDGVGEKETEYFSAGVVGSVTRPKVMRLMAPFLNLGGSTWQAW